MSDFDRTIEEFSGDYRYGFVTDIEAERAPEGLNEDTVKFISAKKDDPNGYWNGALRHSKHGNGWNKTVCQIGQS